MKSPKEEIVEAKILKTVDEIVSKHIQGFGFLLLTKLNHTSPLPTYNQ